jgi:prepilin-type N-terminal cleavage/methylation domain-containing protein
MKISPNIFRERIAGFTLPEILIAMTIFVAVIGAVVALQLFGMRIYYLSATKLTATSDGRETINFIRESVREAKTIYIGDYTNGSSAFVAVGSANQTGSSLLLFPTTNTTYGAIFFQNQPGTNLCSVLITNIPANNTNGIFTGSINSLTTNALFVTNRVVFRAEDFQGNALTNNSNNRIIHVTLQFSMLEYPVAGVGSNQMYDYYQLQTRATRRTID